MVTRQTLDFCAYRVSYLGLRQLAVIRCYHVKYEICMRRSFDHAKIMDRELFVNAFGYEHAQTLHPVSRFIVHNYGIHMDYALTSESLIDTSLDIVDRVMNIHYVPIRADLRVKRYHDTAGTVIVYHQIVYTDDIII